jgi:RNA polymerase sigma factor (TIGR02999 family)
MPPDSQLVTSLLQEWKNGNQEALDQLLPLVYDELRRLAGWCLSAERPEHTLRATELVHEAYLRLVGADIDWQDRAHFYAVAARVIRRILVDHANSRNRRKRGGDMERVPLDESVVIGAAAPEIIVSLDDALRRLAVVDSRKSDIVECLYFGGMTYEETAAALNISAATVDRELRMAKAWIHRELMQNPAAETIS